MITKLALLPLFVCFGAFLIAFQIIPAIITISHEKHLFDEPGLARKIHHSATPNLGGVGLFAAIVIAFSLSGYALKGWSPFVAAGITILFFTGIKDDISELSPLNKLLFQFVAIGGLIVGGNLVITNLGGVFGIHQIPYWVGVALTAFTMVVVLNAYNLIDGVDGLAGSTGLLVSAFFSWWFWASGMMSEAVLSLTITGALLGFLYYNFEPAKIFMGDTGSQIIGYLLSFLAVMFVKTGVERPGVPLHHAVPVLVVALLIVPLYDTLRVYLMRAFRGKSPFSADRRHIHHQLIDLGFSHRACCYIIIACNITIVAATMLLADMNVSILLGIVIAMAVLLFPTSYLKRKLFARFGIYPPLSRRIRAAERVYGLNYKNNSKSSRSETEKNTEEALV